MVAPAAGDIIAGSVRLEHRMAEGGMGNVWVGHHRSLDTRVVVKFISDLLVADPLARERFTREAVAASQVKSPHVVQIFDHGVSDKGLPFIVMELLEGEDLATYLDRRSVLSLRETASILTQVCRALGKAHDRGVIHRDIKPDNIFLCDVGGDEPFIKLLDFGIARAQTPSGNAKTLTGSTVGTPFYMSPEQFMGTALDHRSDLWSLGVVAFECLVGRRPFEAETIGAVAILVHSAPMPVPSHFRPELRPFDAWFLRACARNVSERFATARELAEALQRIAEEAPSSVAALPLRARPKRTSLPSPTLDAVPMTTSEASTSLPPRAIPQVLWLSVATLSVVLGILAAVSVRLWFDDKNTSGFARSLDSPSVSVSNAPSPMPAPTPMGSTPTTVSTPAVSGANERAHSKASPTGHRPAAVGSTAATATALEGVERRPSQGIHVSSSPPPPAREVAPAGSSVRQVAKPSAPPPAPTVTAKGRRYEDIE